MFQLNERDQHELLRIARESVNAYLAGRTPRVPDFPSGPLTQPHSVFVSIHKDGNLRGCIGNIHPSASLVRTTSDCAISAAVGDPRFMPLTIDELAKIDFEISVLSPMERVQDIGTIVVGRDGLFIAKRNARGLLLPQVASSFGWDRERFLAETSRKAGLEPDEWKEGAAIFRFTAHVFHEQHSTKHK
jgi:uncharacterized protein